MIPLKVHNVLDYIIGVVLIATPFLFGFSEIVAARNVFTLSGLFLIAYSLITKYYYSLAKILPVKPHMGLDATLGVVAIASPHLFGYSDLLSGGQYAVHWVLGLGAIGLALLTDKSYDVVEATRMTTPPDRSYTRSDMTYPRP